MRKRIEGMIFRIAVLFLFISGSLCAENWEGDGDENILYFDTKPLFVSLGSHCEVAVQLRENQLRIAAFPFDWIVSSIHEGLIKVLNDGFLHFTDENHLSQNPHYPHLLENCYYYLEFRHSWPFTDFWTNADRLRQQLDEVHSKFERRIERFKQLAAYPGKVFFIRAAFDLQNDPCPYWGIENITVVTFKQAQELRDSLLQFFPQLDFKIVIINYKEENTLPILGIDRVLEFKIRKSNKKEDYDYLFQTLNGL